MKNLKAALAALLVLGFSACVIAQPRQPTKAEAAQLQRLAQQSALHAETALKKIQQAGTLGSAERLRLQVIAPSYELMSEWKAFKLSDAVMMPYLPCQEILSDVQSYGKDAITPPKYHMSMPAVQSLRFIKENLAECKAIATGKKSAT